MTEMSADIYLGFDPGGQNGFGAALLDGDAVMFGTVSTVDDAMALSSAWRDECPLPQALTRCFTGPADEAATGMPREFYARAIPIHDSQ